MSVEYFRLGHQDKDLDDIAEDFRDAIWSNSDDRDVLLDIWAAGRTFIDSHFWEDEFTCLRPELPEGVQRLEASLNNLGGYVLFLDDDQGAQSTNVL